MRIPPVKAIIAFESVARTKSVNRASEELGLTASAVSHQISNLESIIGQPLFYRAGERYLSDVTGPLTPARRFCTAKLKTCENMVPVHVEATR